MFNNGNAGQLDALMNRKTAAEWLGLSEKGLRNYVKQGLLPEIRIGKRRRYRKAALNRALAKLEVAEVA